jgi:NADPH:quinone reductase-like Zn-dependent oxidoreductase
MSARISPIRLPNRWKTVPLPTPAAARADIAELTGLFSTGQLRIAVTTLPLAESVRAHQLLEDRTVVGRLLLAP